MKIVSSRYRWVILRDHMLVWTAAFTFFSLIRNVGTIEVAGFEVPLLLHLLMPPSFGIVFGMLSGLATLYFSERFYRRISLKKFLIARFGFTFSFILSIIFGVFLIYNHLIDGFNLSWTEFISNKVIWVVFFYFLIVDFGLGLFGQVNLMLGRGNMKKIIKGQFYEPQEEIRIFMFLDLKSSTRIAEKIGHLQFSRLIQDCFNDLAVVENYGAEVYQYVGDEAILTWTKKGLRKGNCIHSYFTFQQLLNTKSAYYEATYGHKPFFKAGVHIGKVTVSEVGKYKREIAYHGDTMNTAARIQAKCNELGVGLLLSDTLKSQLPENFDLDFQSQGTHTLKGKEEQIELWSVEG